MTTPDQPLQTFRCALCGHYYRTVTDGATSSSYLRRYRDDGPSEYICQFCAVEHSWTQMEMTGRTVLYFVGSGKQLQTLEDSTGRLRIPISHRREGKHNWGIGRRDVWFVDRRGDRWWGVNYGNWNPNVYCRRLKPPSPRRRKPRRYYALEFGRGSEYPYREGGIPARLVAFTRRADRQRWVEAQPFNLAMRDGRTDIAGTGWVRDPGTHRAVQVWRVA